MENLNFKVTPLSEKEQPFKPQDLNMKERELSRKLPSVWPLVSEIRDNEITKYLIDRFRI